MALNLEDFRRIFTNQDGTIMGLADLNSMNEWKNPENGAISVEETCIEAKFSSFSVKISQEDNNIEVEINNQITNQIYKLIIFSADEVKLNGKRVNIDTEILTMLNSNQIEKLTIFMVDLARYILCLEQLAADTLVAVNDLASD